MVLRLAESVGSAEQIRAWTDASSVATVEIRGAVVVGGALRFALDGILVHAAALVSITGHSLRTHAFVAALLVHALSAIGTWSVGTLVSTDATQERVALESSFAHALRWVGRATLGVDSAREPFAGTSAEISGVNEERRRTNALAGLNTLLVRAALFVRSTTTLSWRAESAVRITIISGRTLAFVSSHSVSTNRIVAAGMRILRALINVNARAVSLGAETLGTSTVADATGNGDALGALRTLFALRAAGEDAVPANQLIRRLALALGGVTLFAEMERIPVEPGGTRALIAAGKVLTDRVDTARGLVALIALVNIATPLGHRVARVSLAADADVSAARIVNALLAGRTGVFIVTLHKFFNFVTSFSISVAGTSAGALAYEAPRQIVTNCSRATGLVKTFVNIDTSTCEVEEAAGAEALGFALLKAALGVGTAVKVLAGMTTVVADVGFGAETAVELVADRVAGTVLFRLARDDGDAADSWVGIGDGAFGADAGIRALRVLANGVLAASVWSRALVDVEALTVGIT